MVNAHDIQNDAVEVEEHVGAEADIEAVVAVERRADDRTLSYRGEAFGQ